MREIKRLVYQGENGTVEFKRKIVHPEKVIREVVAFANTNGGYLLVGVDDNQTIPGLKYPDEEDFLMQKAIKELIRPKVDFETSIIPLSEKKSVICYHIKKSERKPHYAFEKKFHRYGKAFVRDEDRSIQASPEIRQILKFSNEPSDAQFTYGENEKLLFNFLNENDCITLDEFRKLTGLEYKMSSKILVNMVLANALKIQPKETGDIYMAVE